ARAHFPWVAVAVLTVLASILLVARRWQLLVYRGRPLRSFWLFVITVTAAQMLNILLPIRLGEAARIYWINRRTAGPAGRITVTLALERLCDMLALGIGTALLLLSLSLPEWARVSGWIAVITSAVVVITFLVVTRWGSRLLTPLATAFWIPARLRNVS